MLPSRSVPPETRAAYRCDRLASYLAGIYIGGVFPFAAVIAREQLRADALVLSLMTAAPFLGNLCALFWARAMEGREKLPFVKWSHLLARATCLLTFFATTPLRLALILGAVQVIGTVATPAYAAVLKEVYPDSERGRIMSYTRAALFAASVVVTLAVGPLLKVVSYRLIFPVAACFGIAAAFVFSRMPVAGDGETGGRGDGGTGRRGEEEKLGRGEGGETGGATDEARSSTRDARSVSPSPRLPVPPSPPGPLTRLRAGFGETMQFLGSTLRILKEDLRYRWFALSVFTYGFGNLMVAPVVPMVQVDQLHISTSHIALLSIVSQVTATLFYFYWGRFVDRNSPLRAVVINILLTAFIPLLYFYSRSIWMIAPAFVLGGITQAGIDLSYFSGILSFSNEQNASRYQALHSFLLGVRGLIAPFIGGGLARLLASHELDVRLVFLVALFFIIVGCWMQLVGLQRSEEGAARVQVTTP